MDEIYKTYKHNPPHLFRPNSHYFITGATLGRNHFFDTVGIKNKMVEYLFKSFKHYEWEIEDWVLLDNHYHLMAVAPQDASKLPRIINNFHRFSSLYIRKIRPELERTQIFYNYWDTCIDFESSYFSRIHYLWLNPEKHGYVKDAKEWPWGSYRTRARELTASIITKYPCDKLKIKDNF